MFNFIVGARPLSPAPSSQHPALSSQHLLGRAQAYQATGNVEEARKWYLEAVEKAKTEYERNPNDTQAKQAFSVARSEYFTFLQELSISEHQEQVTVASLEGQSHTLPSRNLLPPTIQNNASRSAFSASQSEQVNDLFGRVLSTFKRLEVLNKVSLFLVYAHDNPDYGEAKASIAKYLIKKLSDVRVNLYSDQTPMGQPATSLKGSEGNQQLEDILTSQLCLLPTQLIDGVVPVDKVAVCCSEVLGNYLKWPDYKEFHQALQEAYFKDQKTYRIDSTRANASAIREVVKKFSQAPEYKAGFHHVLTEIAFLQIREEHLKDWHGIISIPLTPKSHASCLSHFISETAVRIGDVPRFEAQARAGQKVYPNQGSHLALFKLIERLLGESDETKLFLDQFWEGYNDLISRLKNRQSALEWAEYTKLLDSIFDNIQIKHLTETTRKLLPPRFSLIDLRKALHQHYQSSNLSIQRVSGDQVSLENCYINLAIVESQAQREKDKKELENQAKTFERLPSGERLEATNFNKLISLDQLFAKQRLHDGSEGIPKRILIQGRAGIGKTTLCKKLVYEYFHNSRWQDQFECVLWVPLRQLKTSSPQRFEDLLCSQYFRGYEKSQAKALVKTFHEHQDKTLFILDGLDEVLEELDRSHPLRGFLQLLLDQKYVVITSRPAGVDTQVFGNLDLQLETIGFGQKNVQAYIEKFAPQSNQVEIQQFINGTSVIQGLVNIPIQLDALCYSWDRLPKNQSITMSMLYDAMVDKLWRKDAIRSKKQDKGKPVTDNLIQHASKIKLEKLMKDEINYLGYLAFKGLTQGKIEFSVEELDQCQEEIENSVSEKKLSFSFIDELKRTSYLHTADAERDEAERHYHFLHLTFQEFFAAKFLAEHLQVYAKVEISYVPTYLAPKNLGVMPKHDELVAFIATNKYNPRYEIVWWMVAGLLDGAALENFFSILDRIPRDLIGGRHQQVMMGCLNEARSKLNPAKIWELEQTFIQSLHFEMKWNENGLSELGRQSLFPEHLLLEELNQSDDKKEQIIQILGMRSILSEKAILALIDLLKNGDKEVRGAAVKALSEQRILSKTAKSELNEMLHNSDKTIRSAASRVLSAHSTRPDAAILRLINDLSDPDKKIKIAAAQALGEQKTLPQKAISALTEALQDNSHEVRLEATKALRKDKKLSETTISSLIQLLRKESKSESKRIVYEVIDLLGEQEKQTEVTISILCDQLQEEDGLTQQRAILALCKQNPFSETVIIALAKVLRSKNKINKDMVVSGLVDHKMCKALPNGIISAVVDMLHDKDLQDQAFRLLGNQNTLPDFAISALCLLLQNGDEEIKMMANWALREHNTLPKSSIFDLSTKLQDEDESVRSNAVSKLGEQKNLSEPVISALIDALKDPSRKVRLEVVKALCQQKTLSESTISMLGHVADSEDKEMKSTAAFALFQRKTISEAVVNILLKTLKDEDQDIRDGSALILGKYNKLPENAIPILLDMLSRNNELIRAMSALALGNNSRLPENAVLALISVLQDEDEFVRQQAIIGLKNQEILTETTISALVDAEKYCDNNIRTSVLDRISKEDGLPENAIFLWIQALESENESLRKVAQGTLANQKNLSETIIYNLTDLLQRGEKDTKHRVAFILEKQKTLPEFTISALSNALQEKCEIVRYWAVKALGKQEELSKDDNRALINVLLNDDDVLNSIQAAKALSSQKVLLEEVICTLNDVLETKKDWRIKDAIASTLSERNILPPLSIPVLIEVLQDNDEKLRSSAIWALSLHLNEIYSLLPRLTPEQTQSVYTKVLFPQSCKKITSLIAQRNQLQFDTVTGQRQSIELSSQQIEKVIEDLLPVRAEAGVALRFGKKQNELPKAFGIEV